VEQLAQARARCPHLDRLASHVTEFAKILTGRHENRLDDWLAAVEAEDDQPGLRSFAAGIRRDHDAVRAGLTLDDNSGAGEGTVNCKDAQAADARPRQLRPATPARPPRPLTTDMISPVREKCARSK